ncbi:hypothetical protein [Sphingomonas morindae]|uniref:Uncharacterized protein n=1 Tax=Sphingomonas morindae TaxID=1541170 RepID=A0ABY4XCG8_9SPHN|nr:hypothetical protein [Sphingomonas morindae]USI74664.1 hypothetical protein LHA26_18105 [Sphingomonas morindae]
MRLLDLVPVGLARQRGARALDGIERLARDDVPCRRGVSRQRAQRLLQANADFDDRRAVSRDGSAPRAPEHCYRSNGCPEQPPTRSMSG